MRAATGGHCARGTPRVHLHGATMRLAVGDLHWRKVRVELSARQREWFHELAGAGEELLVVEMLADWLSGDRIPMRASFRSEALLLAGDMGIEARIAHILAYDLQQSPSE